jgi:hypothetical protein
LRDSIEKLCIYFQCQPGDIYEVIAKSGVDGKMGLGDKKFSWPNFVPAVYLMSKGVGAY